LQEVKTILVAMNKSESVTAEINKRSLLFIQQVSDKKKLEQDAVHFYYKESLMAKKAGKHTLPKVPS
jgi:hypothetical protein